MHINPSRMQKLLLTCKLDMSVDPLKPQYDRHSRNNSIANVIDFHTIASFLMGMAPGHDQWWLGARGGRYNNQRSIVVSGKLIRLIDGVVLLSWRSSEGIIPFNIQCSTWMSLFTRTEPCSCLFIVPLHIGLRIVSAPYPFIP